MSRKLHYLNRAHLPGMSVCLPLGFCSAILVILALTSDILFTSVAFPWTLPSSSRYFHSYLWLLDLSQYFQGLFLYSWPVISPRGPCLVWSLPLMLTVRDVHFTSASISPALHCPGIWMLFSAPSCFSCCHLWSEPTQVLVNERLNLDNGPAYIS